MSDKQRVDALYQRVKAFDPVLYGVICAFASTVIDGNSTRDLQTKFRIEKFCMSLVDRFKS